MGRPSDPSRSILIPYPHCWLDIAAKPDIAVRRVLFVIMSVCRIRRVLPWLFCPTGFQPNALPQPC
jgi:hypothetical protein